MWINGVFPFFPSSVIEELNKELPDYLSAAEDVSSEVDAIAWWKDYEYRLPNWAKACKYIILVQPSSATTERVFFSHYCQTPSNKVKKEY